MAYKLKIVRFFLSLVCIFGGMNLNFIIKILNKFLDFIGIGKFFTKDAGEDSLEKYESLARALGRSLFPCAWPSNLVALVSVILLR